MPSAAKSKRGEAPELRESSDVPSSQKQAEGVPSVAGTAGSDVLGSQNTDLGRSHQWRKDSGVSGSQKKAWERRIVYGDCSDVFRGSRQTGGAPSVVGMSATSPASKSRPREVP